MVSGKSTGYWCNATFTAPSHKPSCDWGRSGWALHQRKRPGNWQYPGPWALVIMGMYWTSFKNPEMGKNHAISTDTWSHIWGYIGNGVVKNYGCALRLNRPGWMNNDEHENHEMHQSLPSSSFSIHVPSIFNHGFLLINAWKMKLLKGFSMMFLFVDHALVIVGEVAMDGPLVFYPKCVQHQTVEKHGCGSMFCCLLTAHQLQISVPKSNLKFARHSSYV